MNGMEMIFDIMKMNIFVLVVNSKSNKWDQSILHVRNNNNNQII